jgi:hypothetical protein
MATESAARAYGLAALSGNGQTLRMSSMAAEWRR